MGYNHYHLLPCLPLLGLDGWRGCSEVVRIPTAIRVRKALPLHSRASWEPAELCLVQASQPLTSHTHLELELQYLPGGHKPCCSLWPICPHRLFDYRGRLSPVPVPRAVPVKRPRVTVPLVRRVKTNIPVKLFARSTAVTTSSAKIKCE